ncbi:MAG: CRISPR-associated endonuclease Cas2 [bacterium]|nr:CRISPR-associated endonuclease Cas2 [bacterium]
MFHVISYDIPDDKRRLRIANTLKDFGNRVQYSVFECILDNLLLEKLVKRINKIVKSQEDSVRIYKICAGCQKNIKIIGLGKVSEDKEVYVV